MRLIKRLACLAVVLLFARDLRAQNAQWFEARSNHFVVYTDTSAAKGKQLLTDFESRVAEMEKGLGTIPPRQFPIEVFLFKRTEDFTEVVPAAHDATIEKSAYLFRGPDRFFVAARDKSPVAIANDVGHALGHVFFERLLWWRPFWLAEGAGEVFRMVGREPDKRKILPEEGFSAPELLKAAPSASYKDTDPATALHLEGYRLVRMLMSDDPSALRSFVEALRGEAGAQAKLELQNTDAISQRLFTEAGSRINPVATTDVQVAPIDAARMSIHRGDLFLAAGKTSEAGRWYNADNAAARAARAVLTRFSRSAAEATRALDRAVRELPDAGLVQFHFGSIEAQAASDITLQETALERAVKLLPLLGRADAELARVRTLGGRPADALPLLDRALQLEPEFADHFFEIRSEALLALARYDDARKAILTASALPHGDRSSVESYDRKVAALARRVEDIRREAEAKQMEQLRSEVAAKVAALEPPKPVVPPPPVRNASIKYTIEAATTVEVLEPTVYPDYPDALVQGGKSGKVTLQVNVGANGRVTQATIAGSQIPEMNAPTIEAVKKWAFKPVLRAGQPASFTIKLVFEYVSQ